LHQNFYVETGFQGGRGIDDVFFVVEAAIDEEGGGENPGERDEAVVDALEDFDFLMIASAALEDDGESERAEEDQAEEDEDEVEFERRIDLADVGKSEGAEEEDAGAGHQVAAKRDFGGGGG